MTVAVFAEATAKASASERTDVDLARTVVSAPVPAKMGNPAEGAREADGRAASTAHDLPHARDADPVAVRGDVTLAAAANASPAFPGKSLKVESPNSSLQSPDDNYVARVDRSTPSDRPSARPRVDDVPTPAPRGDAPAHPTAPASLSDPVDGSAAASPRDASPESAGVAHPGGGGGGGGGRRANGHGNGANPAPLVFDEASREACARCFAATDDEGRLRELCAMGQKELQETFRTAFRRATTSNNNQWLRRRIAGALGIENAFAPSSHAAPRDVGSLAGARGGRVGGAGAGLLGDVAAGTVIAEDGVRKSSRAAKPKILDFLPSAVCVKVANEAPGAAAIDRRVRVFWPAEGAFFSGLVVAFNGKNGKHKIRYDDGDVEEVLLAAERIEWVEPGEDETKLQPRAPAIAAGGGALSSKAKAVVVAKPKMTTFVVPVAGKPAEVLAELGPAWPTPGAHVWGRVKGHGWWPGVVIKPTAADAIPASADAAAMRRVRFFDNTGAAVHRHDLLPFLEYAPTLSNAKKSAGFQTAMKLARASFEKAAKRGLESNLASMTKSQQATAAKAAVGLIPDAAAATEGKRKHVDLADVGGGKRGKIDVAGGVVAELEAARAAEASLKPAPLAKPPIKRSHKKGQGLKARAAAEAAGLPWPPPKPEKPEGARGRGRGSGKTSNGGASARGFVAGLGRVGADAGDQLGLLSRKLEALQTRVVPLAIAASQHLRKQLQLSQLSASRGGQPHPGAIMTDRERATLLEEMESLQRLLSWSDPSRGGAAGEGEGQHASLFDHDAFDGAGARADADAAMRAERDGSDPDLARLDARWERGGLDPIEMAMFRGDADEPMVMSAMDASAAMDAPTMMDGDGVWFTGEEDALDAAALLSAPGPAEDDVAAVIAQGQDATATGATGDANVEANVEADVDADRNGGETMNATGRVAMDFAVKANENEATNGGYGSPSSETLATPAARASSPGAPRRASPATSDTTQ